MANKRHKPDEIVTKLRQVEVFRGIEHDDAAVSALSGKLGHFGLSDQRDFRDLCRNAARLAVVSGSFIQPLWPTVCHRGGARGGMCCPCHVPRC